RIEGMQSRLGIGQLLIILAIVVLVDGDPYTAAYPCYTNGPMQVRHGARAEHRKADRRDAETTRRRIFEYRAQCLIQSVGSHKIHLQICQGGGFFPNILLIDCSLLAQLSEAYPPLVIIG